MPSIEIICVNQAKPLIFEKLPLAVAAENQLVSHRKPSPLFQTDFDQLQGCIYHLGSPYLREPNARGMFTAYLLLDHKKWDRVHFISEFVPSIKQLLEDLMADSPVSQLLFTSDYQFGPTVKRYKRALTLAKFWQLHDDKRLRMNALYSLKP